MAPARFRRLALAVTSVVALAAFATGTGAMQISLDRRAIEDAIAVGQSRMAPERARFHAPYRIAMSQPPVDYVEVVTPFRRVALGAEARVTVGDRGFGQREALELLAASPDRLALYVELTFHPLNTYLGVPAYEIVLQPPGPSRPPVTPLSSERVPRVGARVEGQTLLYPVPGAPRTGAATRGEPMLGGTIIATFDGRLLDPEGRYELVVRDEGKTLARGTITFADLR